MRDTELYREILGLEEPWFVASVDLDVEEGRIDIDVQHRSGVRWPCPECGCELACRDHAPQRSWRHLDTCQFQTLLHARIPRVACPEHGVVQVSVPWAEARARFTLLMERWIIQVLEQCVTLQGACRLLGISWDQAWGVMQRAVARGQARKQHSAVGLVGVDEKAFRKGHRYMTVVSDLERGTVEYVAEDRTTESLSGYWSTLSEPQREGIEGVAMDMWQPYWNATQQWLPEADRKIVFDRFHIMKHAGKAVDTVRKKEHRALMAAGDETLKGTKYLWLYSEENIPDRHRPTLEALRCSQLKVARAWVLKETLRQLWSYISVGWARRFFKKWFWWATHSRIQPMRQLAHMLRRHLDNILTFCRLDITNAVAEGLNSKITAIKQRACGYRNPENFKTAIYFHCGGLDLYPR